MNKLVSAIVLAVVATATAAWLTVNIRAMRKYDEAQAAIGKPFSVIEMDNRTEGLLAEVRASWVERFSEVDGPYSDGLKTVGLSPSVTNLIKVFTYSLPESSLLSPSRTAKAAEIGVIQALLFPESIDRSIHVSADGRLALIRCSTNLVYIFTDDADGLCEAMYVTKENIEPTDPN